MSKLNITVCMGSSCFARGNQENLAYIEEYIKEHGIDANIELEGMRCENKCALTINMFNKKSFIFSWTYSRIEAPKQRGRVGFNN